MTILFFKIFTIAYSYLYKVLYDLFVQVYQ